ncbi:multiheme c-type cytochrome [Pelagicoccus sp. SDUM812003]|uniref:multiheme c-type cytochrome n=1 Tax=Pelagicoccus sp. SDUM812003 TaxID=3041267 RepID=UPI00280F8794|nr:multiheme c-type cytochrome [Pelagicoccus sp. SDUM812003]MDQ8201478.1 multiheme c-type cytochrome [Pelagicoccus sp. SDUM812003]
MKIVKSLLLLYALMMLAFFGCGLNEEESISAGKRDDSGIPDWKDAETCRSCHSEVFDEWSASHHAGANRLVDPVRDADKFGVGELTDAAGRRYVAGERDGEFVLSERYEGGEFVEGKVDAIIGKTPLEQPLLSLPDGRYQAHAMAWDTERKEWFNVFGDEERLRGEWGHWTGQGMTWNSNCAWCHVTEYEKNYDPDTDSYASEWSRMGISCISCHSGMEEHVRSAVAGSGLVTVEPVSETAVLENCASCHSRREELTDSRFIAGDDYEDHFRLMLYDHPTAYFEDGKADEENFVYGSFMHSGMGHAGVSCMDCHNPHSAELTLPAENNATCIQCHSTGNMGATLIDLATHSRHRPGSGGDSCVDCHMPERTYMARDPRRDHGFTIPDPYMKKEFGVPTACTDCHAEESTEWLLERFDNWYGPSERINDLRARGHLLENAWEGEIESPDEILDRLEAAENPFWRASWLRMLRPFAQEQSVRNAAVRSLDAEHPLERDAALFLLGIREDAVGELLDGLEDESRLVRLQAAENLSERGVDLEGSVAAEHMDYLKANADRPSGALRLARVAAREGDADLTRRMVEVAVSFDRRNPALRYDASILLDRAGLPEAAIRHLRVAIGYAPRTALYRFSIGLLEAELGRLEKATQSMEAAVELAPENDRWHYNLAIVRARLGDREGAKDSLSSAIELAPENADYRSFMQNLLR